MELIRIYLDTTAINSFLFGIEKEPDRYSEVAEILNLLKQGQLIIVISYYTLLELYWFCMDNFPEKESKERARKALVEVLSYPVELVPLLNREDKLRLIPKFPMSDASDIPHAMMSYVHNCKYIVSYDSHFEEVADVVEFLKPKGFMDVIKKKKNR